MSEVIVAVVTFLGTLVAAALGLWQWSKNRKRDEAKTYRDQRAIALASVWNAVCNIEEHQRLQIRNDGPAKPSTPGEVAKMNMVLLRGSPFLLDDETEWSQQLVQRIVEIDTVIRVADMRKGGSPEWWGVTMNQPPEGSIVAEAASDLLRLKGLLGQRYRQVLKGEHP